MVFSCKLIYQLLLFPPAFPPNVMQRNANTGWGGKYDDAEDEADRRKRRPGPGTLVIDCCFASRSTFTIFNFLLFVFPVTCILGLMVEDKHRSVSMYSFCKLHHMSMITTVSECLIGDVLELL